MKNICFAMILTVGSANYAQVGVGTTNPSPAAMLEISSTSDGGSSYKAFMPPRVPTAAARNSINAAAADTGLIVFVDDLECLQIWNGTSWESVHCLNEVSLTGVFQNFDMATDWGYTSDIAFFDNGTDGYYGITDNTNGGFSNITSLTNNFLGILDMDDEGINGTPGFATITFNTIDVSGAAAGSTLSFDYEFFEFDTGDDAYYRVTIDGIPQTEVQLINGLTNLSIAGSVSVTIPAGSNSVGLSIRIRQDGAGDYAGFDNFALVPN
ncbi:MAG: hypothetical protein AAFP76_17420 [Bacteroidota bacterium]